MPGRVARDDWGMAGPVHSPILSGLALRPDPNGSAAVDVCRYDYRHARCKLYTTCLVQGTSCRARPLTTDESIPVPVYETHTPDQKVIIRPMRYLITW